MSTIDMSAELVDALQATKTEIERLENILKERDATIAKLKPFEAAFYKACDSDGHVNDTETKAANTTHAMTPTTFIPFVERTILPLLKGGMGDRTVVVTVPEDGVVGRVGVCFPIAAREGTEIRGVLGDLRRRGEGK